MPPLSRSDNATTTRGYPGRRVTEDEAPDARRRKAIGRTMPKPLRTI